MEVGVIFQTFEITKSVSAMLGIIDSLDAKVDRLVQSELNAGFRNLDQACRAEAERETLLREARGCFNKAVSLETGFRKGLALLGSAVCHHQLRDKANSRRCLEELVLLPPAVSLVDKVLVHGDNQGVHLFWSGMTVLSFVVLIPILIFFAPVLLILGLFGSLSWFVLRLKEIVGGSRWRAYRKRKIMEAVAMNREATSLLQLQQAVSQFTGTPVPWLVELDPSAS